MSLTLVLLILSTLLPNPGFHPGSESTMDGGYEIQIGGRVYMVTPGQAFTIVTPAGERLTAILRLAPTLHYSRFGIKFDYLRQMAVKTAVEPVPTIMLNTLSSVMAIIEVLPPTVTSTDAENALRSQMMQQWKTRGISGPMNPWRTAERYIAGALRKGSVIQYTTSGQTLRFECYAFSRQGTTTLVAFQHDLLDASESVSCFDLISRSMK